jgi:hypothetical protein
MAMLPSGVYPAEIMPEYPIRFLLYISAKTLPFFNKRLNN